MTWILFGLLVVLVLAPLLLGLAMPKHQQATRVELIKAPTDQVWAALSDLSRQGEWRSDVKSLQMKDDDEGMRWIEDSSTYGKLTLRKLKEVPQRELVVQLEKSAKPCGTRQAIMHSVPGGTRVTFKETAELHSPFARVRTQFGSLLDKRLNEYIRQFKTHFGSAT